MQCIKQKQSQYSLHMPKQYVTDVNSTKATKRTQPSYGSTLISLPELKPYYLRKSVFNPLEGLAESIASRMHHAGIEVPAVQVVHYSRRWLLMQAPTLAQTFFSLLHSGKLGNIYAQLLRIFKLFTSLTKIYGFFVPTLRMIFMEGLSIKVWINEDIFSDQRMTPLDSRSNEQQQFVAAFGGLVKQMSGWNVSADVLTIDGMVKLLEEKMKQQPNNRTKGEVGQMKSDESPPSYEPSQVGLYSLKPNSYSYQYLQHIRKAKLKDGLSRSLKPQYHNKKVAQKLKNSEQTFNETNDEKDIKSSVQGRSLTADGRSTKKKFGLHSTSSSLQKYSDRWCSTMGKIGRKNIDQIENVKKQSFAVHSHSNHEHPGIVHELEGLFGEKEPDCFQIQVDEDHQQSLERIAEEIEEVLIW